MAANIRYEWLDIVTTAAAGGAVIAAERYGVEQNPDAALWDSLRVNRVINPGDFIVQYVNEFGLERYKNLRREIIGKIGQLSVDSQG